MEKVVPDADQQALQHMLSESAWSERAVLDQMAQNANRLLGEHANSALLIRDRTSYLRYRTAKLVLSRSCSLRWSHIFLVATDDGRSLPASPRWDASGPGPR